MPTVALLFHDVYTADPAESGFDSAAADVYKLSVAELDAQLEGVSATDLPIVLPPTQSRSQVIVTVDDGGVSYATILADRLEARGWRGACFMTTDCIGQRGFLDAHQLRDLDARGHLIGSHSASHPTRFSACTPERMREEWTRSRGVLEDLLGHPVEVASLPGGYYAPAVARTAADAGVRLLFTSEPETTADTVAGCTVVGRFTIRRGSRPGLARDLVSRAPWTRTAAWVSWQAKGLVKPALGPLYPQIAALFR